MLPVAVWYWGWNVRGQSHILRERADLFSREMDNKNLPREVDRC